MEKIRQKNMAIFILFALILGAAAGTVIWALIFLMSTGINLLWHTLPQTLGLHMGVYTVSVCITGGLIIGLWQKKYGDFPETLETVMHKLKTNGSYPYNQLHVLAIAALLPLVFGGSLGPEAGLTGVIVGLCCWVGDHFKYKSRQIRELAEAGTAATLSVIFNSPFFGIASNFEDRIAEAEEEDSETDSSEPRATKKEKLLVYVAAVAGGFGAMLLLKMLAGGGMGIPRFTWDSVEIARAEIFAFIPLALLGVALAVLYCLFNKLASVMAKPLQEKKITRGILGGIILAFIGLAFPWTMFSGEHEMGTMMEIWQTLSPQEMLLTSVFKLLLICLCINFGWRGGTIFPIIFAGTSMGFAMATLLPVNPVFCVGVVIASLCGYQMRKPLAVTAVLVLCFPVNMLIPIAASAYLSSLIPEIPKLKVEE